MDTCRFSNYKIASDKPAVEFNLQSLIFSWVPISAESFDEKINKLFNNRNNENSPIKTFDVTTIKSYTHDYIIIFNTDPFDTRDHRNWLRDDYDIDMDTFENIPSGYMEPKRFQLFKGSEFKPILLGEIDMRDIKFLCQIYRSKYNNGYDDHWDNTVTLYNGYDPLYTVATININTNPLIV